MVSEERERADDARQAWGSDYIADLLKAYDFEFVTFNPGASFRGIEESIVNYNDNEPQVITTPNESLSVSIAHGYAKATGRTGLCILHNVVGTMNASMAIYNAFIDRVPILMLSGTGPMRKSQRRPWIDWIHTANVQGNIVRDFVKWDDQPSHIDGIETSFVRAKEIAETKPCGPTYVTLDHELQEQRLEEPMDVPEPDAFPTPSAMGPDPRAIAEASNQLVNAEFPVILVDQVGDSRAAVHALVSLAELLGAPVVDVRWRRFNFPNTHPLFLCETDVWKRADVVLALDVWEMDMLTKGQDTSVAQSIEGGFTLIDVGTHELGASGLFPNTYDIHERDLAIMADTELAIPALRDGVADAVDADADFRSSAEDRWTFVEERHDEQRERWRRMAEEVWDETPISSARLAGEVWETIRDEEWVLVNDMFPPWARRLWEVDEYDQYIGGYDGGGGVGYGIGASIGAALGVADSGRVPVNLQGDGDLMQYLGGLWVLGRYDIPLLTVMHNNRSMHNSTNHRMKLAGYRGRDASHERALVGTGYVDPTPDYATVAESLGVEGYGPIEDPDELAPALTAALADVKAGRPALVDVICQSE